MQISVVWSVVDHTLTELCGEEWKYLFHQESVVLRSSFHEIKFTALI